MTRSLLVGAATGLLLGLALLAFMGHQDRCESLYPDSPGLFQTCLNP